MSGFNYNKWDNIDSDSDDEPSPTIINTTPAPAAAPAAFNAPEQAAELSTTDTTHLETPATTMQAATSTPLPPSGSMPSLDSTSKGSEKGRYEFRHEGQLIYEWCQDLDCVSVFIKPPPTLPSGYIVAEIRARHLKVGLRGGDQWFLDEDTGGVVDVDESTWTISGEGAVRELEVVMTKASRASIWEGALLGRDGKAILDPLSKQEVQKELMLERFGEENPGFDFRNADFNGAVPDAKNFMGGAQYR